MRYSFDFLILIQYSLEEAGLPWISSVKRILPHSEYLFFVQEEGTSAEIGIRLLVAVEQIATISITKLVASMRYGVRVINFAIRMCDLCCYDGYLNFEDHFRARLISRSLINRDSSPDN